MAESFTGTWQTITSNNLCNLLKAVGSPFLVRNLAPRVKPVQVIRLDGNHMLIKNETGFTTSEVRIPLDGSRYCEKTNLFPQPFCGTTNITGGVMTTCGTVGDTPLKITRKLVSENCMELVTESGDIVATRILEKQLEN